MALDQAPSLLQDLRWLHLTQVKNQKPVSLKWFVRNLMTQPLWHRLWLSSWLLCLSRWWQCPLRLGSLPLWGRKICRVSLHVFPGPALQLPSLWLGSIFIQFVVCRFCFHMWFFFLLFAVSICISGVKTQATSAHSCSVKGVSDLCAGFCCGLNVPCMILWFSLNVLETIGLIQIHLKDMKLCNTTFNLQAFSKLYVLKGDYQVKSLQFLY